MKWRPVHTASNYPLVDLSQFWETLVYNRKFRRPKGTRKKHETLTNLTFEKVGWIFVQKIFS